MSSGRTEVTGVGMQDVRQSILADAGGVAPMAFTYSENIDAVRNSAAIGAAGRQVSYACSAATPFMRKSVAIQLIAPMLAGLALVAQAPRVVTIEVDFLADGRCTVSAAGEDFHSTLTYARKAADEADAFRCAVPPVPDKRPVGLIVALAPHERPSGRGTPRLAWSEKDGRWVGRASLTAAPEVVVVEDWNGRKAVTDRWLQRGAIGVLVVALGVVAFRRFRRGPTPRSL